MEILTYSFFQHALLGALFASILCGVVGTYVVTRRLVIVGGGVAHASLGGVGMGAFFGFSPLLGATGFALLTGLGIHYLGRNRDVREDAIVAMLWTLGMSVGLIFAFLTPGFVTDLPSYLFGSILTINTLDLWLIGTLTLVTLLLFAFLLRPIQTLAYDADFARTQGLPVQRLEIVMTALIALTIVSCLQLVGIILVVALLSIPQSTAALFVRTFRGMMIASSLIAYISCVGGLTLSYVCNIPSGASIILISIVIYLAVRIIKKSFRR